MTPSRTAEARPARVLVVGSGIAGLTAALTAASCGAEVVIVTKARVDDAATTRAQGGIAGVIFPDDALADHAADTMRASAGLADPDAVRALVAGGTEAIAWLIDHGVRFDRDAAGRLEGGLEGAHSYPRILHAGGDATGAEIERALVAAVRAAGIGVRERTMLADIALRDGSAVGAHLMDPDGTVHAEAADAVILATGGAGQAYARTTNPVVATGDGIAAALRAGADVAGMEFVQFHPTVLAAGEPFLVSEAVRGEGAVLLDEAGARFCLDAHPDGELAPRDVVARAVADAMARQGGRPVLLDATRLGDALATRFPTIDRAVRERGLDWAREPIPVAPAAHYLMGGVVTDLDGRTSIPGLYAAGETAHTGVHGANRLASNSLLEGAVFGARAGAAAADEKPASAPPHPTRAAGADDAGIRERRRRVRRQLPAVMWRDAGLTRDEAGLARAASRLEEWIRAIPEPSDPSGIELRNLLTVSREIVRAARARTDSLGAHHRSDAIPAGVPA
jgi:L-aspartate oxidase